MTQVDKQLVLQDLSARLPYEPVIEYVVKGITGNAHMTCKLDVLHIDELLKDSEDSEVKPYLRPLSSMTEEEREFLNRMALENSLKCIEEEDPQKVFLLRVKHDAEELAYLYEHHYDVFGLIPARLALSTDEFNPYV